MVNYRQGSKAKFSNPAVALETTVLTHGLPRPQNLALAREVEQIVREHGATPLTVAVVAGKPKVGLTDAELEELAASLDAMKISIRDIPTAMVKKKSGGTTVAATMLLAHRAGVEVFSTGGIGGVHGGGDLDISADLPALATIPMIVVCAGAKAILDLSATLETLETMSIPVIGYGTDEFPAFYSRQSGLNTSVRLDAPEEVVRFAQAHWSLGSRSALLVCQPLPPEEEIPGSRMEEVIHKARLDARKKGIHGQALTPFLLASLADLTCGESLRANLALLRNNARLAAQIAVHLHQERTRKEI